MLGWEAQLIGCRSPSGMAILSASLEILSPVEDAFSLLCAVEKWPAWLSFVRSASPVNPRSRLAVGSEVIIRSSIPGEEEQIYEVDQLITNYHLSLVGAYSMRRRLDFRLERKTTRAKLHVKLAYPAYHGRIGEVIDHLRAGRKLDRLLDDALLHFKGMVEHSELAVVDADC
jgi:hypothetical protein